LFHLVPIETYSKSTKHHFEWISHGFFHGFSMAGMAILRGLAFALYGWPCPGTGTEMIREGCFKGGKIP